MGEVYYPSIDAKLACVVVLRVKGDTTKKTNDKDYVCTSVNVNLEIDKIPSADVVIGCGTSIVGSKAGNKIEYAGQTPEDLLSEVLEKQKNENSMKECSLYFADSSKSEDQWEELFRGVIVSGNVSYSTDPPTTKSITFKLANKAVELNSIPVGTTMTVTETYLVEVLRKRGNLAAAKDSTTAESSKQVSTQFGQPNNSEISALSKDKGKKSVLEHVATCLDYAIHYCAYMLVGNGADSGDWKSKIMNDYMCSDWAINDPPSFKYAASPTITARFDEQILKAFIASGSTSSVWAMIENTVLNSTYMLTLIPRGATKEFKLELAPSTSWCPSKKLSLDIKYVNGIFSSFSPSVTLYTPDVFIVNYYDYISSMLGEKQKSGLLQQRPGIYAPSSELMTKLKNAAEKGRDLTVKGKAQKIRVYHAPKWLTPLLTMEVKQRVNSVADLKMPAKSTKDNAATDVMQCVAAADLIAQALFGYVCGNTDTCRIDLSLDALLDPTVKLNLLDNLGNAVDVEFPTSEKSLSIRGTLYRLEYIYENNGGNTRMRFTLYLKNVRPLSNELSVECPLYKKLT